MVRVDSREESILLAMFGSKSGVSWATGIGWFPSLICCCVPNMFQRNGLGLILSVRFAMTKVVRESAWQSQLTHSS